jgi:hypothetical protein
LTVGAALAVACLSTLTAQTPPPRDERVSGEPGKLIFHPLPVPEEWRNPVAPAEEEAFWRRANEVLGQWSFNGRYGNKFFENEKRSYPSAFIDFLQGNRETALAFLQQLDDDPHARKETKGIDWFPSFTIKSQTRKYFFFGQYLDPEYRKRMFDSARIWTERDPLRRPNAFFKPNTEGWTPEAKNSWVDVRNTDNLRAMRDVAVYLMAEETGNQETAKLYLERLQAYANALFMTGMGEWDSANYLAHTFTGYLPLYDFARDPAARGTAKAVLDWLSTAAAFKYFRGNWAGPNKRDYNNIPQFEGAPGEFWLYFGDTPRPPEKPHVDLIHPLTSAYRPPAAVLGLARKEFARPVEVLSSKPTYERWFRNPEGETEPEFFETNFISEKFQVGTLATGAEGDVNGFRLATNNPETGSDIWILSTSARGYVGGITAATAGGDRIAQYRNLILFANPAEDASFYFLIPRGAKIEQQDGVTFFQTGEVWVALRSLRAGVGGIDEEATEQVTKGAKRNLEAYQVWVLRGEKGAPAAVALEIADTSMLADAGAFRRAVLGQSQGLEQKPDGTFWFTGSQGETVGLRLTEERLPVVFRNGEEHDWKTHWALYATTPGSASEPLALGWKEGELRVRAGDTEFEGLWKDGQYRFRAPLPDWSGTRR